MKKLLGLLALCALAACVDADGRHVLGVSDEQQTFSLTLTGQGTDGARCWAEGHEGTSESLNDVFGRPQVRMKGAIQTDHVRCRMADGTTYMSLINQTVGLGWWSNIAMVRYVEGSMFLRATMDVPHGRRIYQSGMIRLPS